VTQISTLLIQPVLPCFQRKYAFEDFAIRQVALLLNNTADEAKYANRSLVRAFFFVSAFLVGLRTKVSPRYQSYRNVWDPDVTSDGFRGNKNFFFFGMISRGFEAAPLTRQPIALGTQDSCRNASRMALSHRRTPQTVHRKTNSNRENAHCKVTTLSAFMNRHPGSTVGSRLTTPRTLSL
jgi:hypothetical protein